MLRASMTRRTCTTRSNLPSARQCHPLAATRARATLDVAWQSGTYDGTCSCVQQWPPEVHDTGTLRVCVIGGNVALGEPLADDYKWLNGLPHYDGPRRSIVGSDHACINVAVSIGLAAARRTGR